MKLTSQKGSAYGMFGLSLLCLLAWLMNIMGWIQMGSPVGQLVMAPVCLALGIMIFKSKPRTK
jgi:hypothetical protein